MARFSDKIAALWEERSSAQDASLTPEEREFFRPARNALDWMTAPHFLGHTTLHEWYGSWMIVRDFFQLRCPTCNPGGPGEVVPRSGGPKDCWGKSADYLKSEVLLEWDQDELEDRCPGCGVYRSEFLDSGLMTPYNQMHLLVGMRSGKTLTAALMHTYIEHFYLCLAHTYVDPKTGKRGIHGYLDSPKGIPYEMTFIASSEAQAKDTIWAVFRNIRATSPWIQKYANWVKGKEKEQKKSALKAWEYSEEDKLSIRNGHPDVQLIISCANSNSGGTRGRTRIAGGVDELGYMKNTDGPASGDAIYSSIESSLATVRSEVLRIGAPPWLGSMVSVSSPKSQNDAAFRLWKKSGDVEQMLSHRLPTWDFNPRQPRKNFDSAYAKDPIAADTDFGANPPGADSPFIGNPKLFGELAIGTHSPVVTFENYVLQRKSREYVATRIATNNYRWDTKQRFVFADAGQNFDAFSVACGHMDWTEDDERKTVIDWVCRIVPLGRREIYFRSVYNIVKELHKEANIVQIRFDRWQSTQMIQDLREFVDNTESMSLRPNHYAAFYQDFASGKIALLPPQSADTDWTPGDHFEWRRDPPYMAPESAALYELLALERSPESGKVYNPNKGLDLGWNSDDTAQVMVGVHALVQSYGFNARHDDYSRRAAKANVERTAPVFQRGISGIVRTQGRVPPGARKK